MKNNRDPVSGHEKAIPPNKDEEGDCLLSGKEKRRER